jgi:cytochrome P450
MLLDARDDSGKGLSDVQIREETRGMFGAGHETTATALFWSLYLIARHPEHERRLHDEVDALASGPTVQDLPHLVFTRMVVDEAMRLYPSIVWLGRVAAAEDVIDGFVIPAGSPVTFCFYVIHRHPDFWERPDVFDPDRFAPERAETRVRNAYLPFGLGPRQCIGSHFAMMEAQIVLATIARRYRLRLDSDEEVQPELLATLRPRPGAVMRAEPR